MRQLDSRAEFAVVAALIAFIIPSTALELGSESLSLNTYYPSPLGIYSQLTTTGNTTLARDGGSITIGQSGVPVPLTLWGNLTVEKNITAVGAILPSAASGVQWPKSNPYTGAVTQTRMPYMFCRQISAQSPYSGVYVQCAADEMQTFCDTTIVPSGTASCWNTGNFGSTAGKTCGAWCGDAPAGEAWDVYAICCKVVAQ